MTTPVPGWYPEPSGAPGERWWNGATWTDDVRPPSAPPPAVPAPAQVPAQAPVPAQAQVPAEAPHGWDGFGHPAAPPPVNPTPAYGTPPPPMYATTPQPGGRPASWVARNGYSLATVGVVAAYVLILAFAHVVFLGILPLFMGIRAVARKEMLAWPAIVISVAAIVFGFYELVH